MYTTLSHRRGAPRPMRGRRRVASLAFLALGCGFAAAVTASPITDHSHASNDSHRAQAGDCWDDQFSTLGMNNTVRALLRDGAGNLYVGGQFTMAGGAPANYVARWNGTSWSALGAGPPNNAFSLARDASGNLYVGSAGNVFKWNGSTWTSLSTGIDGFVYALAFDGSGNLFAGGSFNSVSGTSASRIAKYNGTSWSALGAGVNGEVYALAFDGTGNLLVGGAFTTAGGMSIPW